MTKYPYEVYRTAFHGGQFVSRHASLAAAERAVSRARKRGCTCGCAGIIDRSAGQEPGTRADQDAHHDPYAIGSV